MQNDPYDYLPASLRPQKGAKLPPGYVASTNADAFHARAAMGPEPTANPAHAPSALADYLRLMGYQQQPNNSPTAYADLSRPWAVGA